MEKLKNSRKRTIYIALATSLCLMMIAKRSASQTEPSAWAPLDQRPIPTWWTDAKFGIFIHWGLYSVPAYAPVNEVKGVYEKYAEHYENRLIQGNKLFTAHHQKFYGDGFKYSDFASMFKAEYFKPEEWAELFVKSGAKYVVLTSKHHDGFCLWPSKESNQWNSVDAGPHRDLAGDLTNAVRAKGLKMGFYYSLLEWTNPLYKPETIANYVTEHMLPQMKDLVTRYKPEVIFADGEWDYESEKLKSTTFLSWLYNESPVKSTVVVNDRWGKETRSKHGGYYTTEYDLVHDAKGIGKKASHPWEESRGIGTSYGFNRFETLDHYATSQQLVELLIDKVSNGGNLLLNIGPDANGLIPIIMQERLLDIGAWLKVNGEAIYGSTGWAGGTENNKDQGVFYTQNGQNIYVICTKWPQQDLIVSALKKATKVSLLGSDTVVKSSIKDGKLHISPPSLNPATMPCQYAWVFKVAL